jgi:hypothetical protein
MGRRYEIFTSQDSFAIFFDQANILWNTVKTNIVSGSTALVRNFPKNASYRVEKTSFTYWRHDVLWLHFTYLSCYCTIGCVNC